MEKVEIEQEKVEDQFDCEGFLADGELWSKDVADLLAKANEIGEFSLSDNHWKVIKFVRDFYNEHGTGPAIVRVVKHTGLSLKDICGLFPCGLVKGAYKLAGLPKPPGCT
jgi:TusE/DsrC/DsvC family sulfur relay protein